MVKKQVSLEKVLIPVIAVRDVVAFPWMVLPLTLGRDKSVEALNAVTKDGGRNVLVLAQKKIQQDDPESGDLYSIGCVAQVMQSMKMPDGTVKVLLEAGPRMKVESFQSTDPYFEAWAQELSEDCKEDTETVALARQARQLFEQYARLSKRIGDEIVQNVIQIESFNRFADTLAGHLTLKTPERQKILETLSVDRRLEKLIEALSGEIEILNLERRIQTRVRSQIEKSQKEYYLTEQMKAIQKELKQKDDFQKEVQELAEKIAAAKMTPEAEEAAKKECARLEKMMPYSPEATVIRTYLECMIELPWNVRTEDQHDLTGAEKILNAEHFGLEKAKERILEYLAVLKLVKKIKGPILCFVGPPGVGKTSLAQSVAHALGRKFVRVALGGVRDEAEIRGHRRTYIGSLPGRILQQLRKAKSKNPVFLLDEIDKMGSDWRGDPTAALLEVLDPEQNQNFVDHYIDVGFDLSEVLFITTANTLYSIPQTLQDRLEIIRFSGYTELEKMAIARNFLIPRQLKEHGLKEKNFTLDEAALVQLIRGYTRESGVRSLERHIAKLCRKAARAVAKEGENSTVRIQTENIIKYLGPVEFLDSMRIKNGVGVVTGLAWTEHGGETLAIEVTTMPGKGKLTLTGKLGSVMQESAQAALSLVRSRAKELKIAPKFFMGNDFHIHVPEGAVPKDGPSAGVALTLAIASQASGKPVQSHLAMTGEITLRGKVLAIGGLKEKVLAAHREGIKTVLFPKPNEKDLEEIPEEVKKDLTLQSVETMEDVFRIGFNSTPLRSVRLKSLSKKGKNHD